MKTIRTKLNLLMFLTLATAIGFGAVSFGIYKEMDHWQDRVSESLLLRDDVKDIKVTHKDSELIKKLRVMKVQVSESERRDAISNLIQAQNSNNAKLFNKRIEEFEKVERKFFKFAQWKIAKLKSQVQFYLLIATLLPLLGLCSLIYYFNYKVFTPLQRLSKKMMEFLIDQYTFHFSSPPDNEIGNLERTFNSLAQKVLNNLDELHALDRAKSEFVSIASHELRTPLTSIKGSLGLLSNEIVGKLDKESMEMVSVAEQETDRLVRLINDMLDLAKIEARSLTLKKEWNCLDEILEKTVLGIHGFATAASVHVKIENRDDQIEVLVDPDRVQQVLTNLISNAIKYSPEQGVVRIEAIKNDAGEMEICIKDQGRGISEENQKLIFEKFRQATDSSTHLVKGTGLGLAISKALIEEHNGTIGVRSKEGQGSTFYFTLPEWQKIDNMDNGAESNKAA